MRGCQLLRCPVPDTAVRARRHGAAAIRPEGKRATLAKHQPNRVILTSWVNKQIAQRCITDDIDPSVVLNPNQYGALVSWAFNVGCGNSGTSTLVELLNQGEDPDEVARQELPQWNRGADDVLPGLVRRRAAEVGLFTTPADGVAHPAPC